MSVLCEGVKMDIEVIDKVNANSQYMKKEEIKIIMNMLSFAFQFDRFSSV